MREAIKRLLLLLALAGFLVLSGLAQDSAIDGQWYGAINPPGARFDIAIHFQKKAGAWTGTLMMENGVSRPLSRVSFEGNSIEFSLDGGRDAVTFKGALSADAGTISGEFTQGGSQFPFTLTRTPTAELQGASAALDPDELLGMMTSFSGSLADRPFVPPLTYSAIEYGVRASRDPVAKLISDIQEGKIMLKSDGERGYLRSLLEALDIPVESQMAVFSRTSVQGQIIGPANPRALYFNDSVAVGYVRGGFIELAAQDSEQGMSFYMLPQQPADKPFFIKRDQCLSCHLSRNSLDIPGMLVRSVYPSPSGTPINQLGSHLMDHRTRFEERWGGWYVTGGNVPMRHLGNGFVSNPDKPEAMVTEATLNAKTLKDKFDTDAYLSPYSDIAALMVFDHQMHAMNLLTRVGWEFRVASSLEKEGRRNDAIASQLRDALNELVDYFLFVDEAPLSGKVQGSSGFVEKFAAKGPADSKGRSLRQFDLEHRMMRYPCSYMIYAPAFEALPADAKKGIYQRIRAILSGDEKDSKYARLSAADRQAVLEILGETKQDF